ncbi:HtaA domain-containing protein [Streptomyces sp. WMMC500]|uniref:HtaA domain-containing protein n=1 Tax=Streptomyces sp. WMMC500 TaxID=3015154 RepID=UPI00248C7891|nr:HtaA domain-containing protein [Streptomyces sp. WMMC500]WBB61472.1 HtaA domain-containing protein [Streptomyces sp. WMMC500]
MLRRLRALAATLQPGRRFAAAAAAALLTGGLAVGADVAAAPPAQAAARTVDGGRLDWGIKESFLTYVTGPIAQGEWTLLDGAASGFRFHSATGSYDPETGALTAAFGGGVRFTGHEENGTHRLDMTLRGFTVRIADGRGTLHADVASKDRETGRMSTSAQAALADLDLGGLDMRGGGSPVALDGVRATLTAEGERAFAGYYPAGTELDPVSLSVDVRPPAAGSDDDPEPSEKPEGGSAGDLAGNGRQAAPGEIVDGAVDWGVRRTFRDYVTGPVAQGNWRLGGGAEDGGALFRFGAAEGSYDARKQRLEAGFAGTLHFTGERLDLRLSEVSVTVEDGTGTLVADVADDGTTAGAVPVVTFTAGRLTAKDGLVSVSEAPAKLTAEGARAFGGMYEAGTAMDPVSVAVALDADARLPALPDLGSDPSPNPNPRQAEPAKEARAAAGSEPAGSSSTSPAVPLGVGGAGVLLAALVAYALVRRRRLRTTAPVGPDAPAAPAAPEATDAAGKPGTSD